jgi:hypothetical protein
MHVFDANNRAARVIKDDSDTSFSVTHIHQKVEGSADDRVEFDFRVLGDGHSASARYANNSNYRNDSLIRKESTTSSSFSLYHC